jgi:hypothetical protein
MICTCKGAYLDSWFVVDSLPSTSTFECVTLILNLCFICFEFEMSLLFVFS